MKLITIFLLTLSSLLSQSYINGSRTINGSFNFCIDNGSTDDYACNIPNLPGYRDGTEYSFKANTANTGAASINFSSLGAKTIVKREGGITTALANNDIRSGMIIHLTYDGTNMQCSDCNGNAPVGGGAASLTSNAGDAPWIPWGWPGFQANTSMVAGTTYLWLNEREVASQYRKFCLPVETGAASKVAIAALYTRASNGDLTQIGTTSTFSVATANIACGDWSSGSAVSGGVLTVPAAQNLFVAVCSDGTPAVLRASSRADLHLNGWNGSAFTRKLLAFSTSACTGTGGSTALASTIVNADYTAANASSGHLSGHGTMYYFVP